MLRLTGQLINQSGQIVNVAHVLGTFYDKSGNVVWVADQYIDTRAAAADPSSFSIPIPEDLARQDQQPSAQWSPPTASEVSCEARTGNAARSAWPRPCMQPAIAQNLSAPRSVEAGAAFSIECPGSGKGDLTSLALGRCSSTTCNSEKR